MSTIVGIMLISAVLIGLFIITANAMGFLQALAIWLLSISLTAIIVLGALLMTGVINF